MIPGRRAAQGLPRRCDGFVLITVIFIMVVLGALAALLAENLGGQYAIGNFSRLEHQARYAAASGVEWARDRALQAGVCASAEISLADFAVSIECTALAITEETATYSMYDIEAVAVHGSYGSPDFIQRTMRSRFSSR